MVDAVFIQSCQKEIISGRLLYFLKRLSCVFDFSIPTFLFLDESRDQISFGQSSFETVYFKKNYSVNETTLFFKEILYFKKEEFRKVLLLETDCFLLHGFIDSINADIKNAFVDFFVLGSRYYGSQNLKNKYGDIHINGVGVYNRTEQNISLLDEAIYEDKLLDYGSANYDFAFCRYICKKYGEDFYKKIFLDVSSVLNICKSEDFGLEKELFSKKPSAKVVHSKSTEIFPNSFFDIPNFR